MIGAGVALVLAVVASIVAQFDPMTLLSGIAELGVVFALFAAVCAAEAFN
jgi:hypothetical protein